MRGKRALERAAEEGIPHLMMEGLCALQLAHCRVGMRARKSEISSDMASDSALVSSFLCFRPAQLLTSASLMGPR